MDNNTYCHFEKLLIERNLKASDIAKATGILKTTLSDWKYGRSQPKLDKLKKIADFLEVPVTKLLGIESVNKDKNIDIAYQIRFLNDKIKNNTDIYFDGIILDDKLKDFLSINISNLFDNFKLLLED